MFSVSIGADASVSREGSVHEGGANPVERVDPVVADHERWSGEPILSPTRISIAASPQHG